MFARYNKRGGSGFTLPSVLITSIVLMTVLLAGLQLSAATARSLREQYYYQLAREAAESGVAYAQECLQKNSNLARWSDVNQLRPQTDCTGVAQAGWSDTVQSGDRLRTSFEVKFPQRFANNLQRIPSTGKTEVLRRSDGRVVKTYYHSVNGQTGSATLIDKVAFGYIMGNSCNDKRLGSFFATIDEFSRLKAAGLNSCGQLGNGTNVDSTEPRNFNLPAGQTAIGVYTNFLSVGTTLSVLTDSGEVWSAGDNRWGQLGGNYVSDHEALPVKYQLPSGVKAKFVSPLGFATFVVAENGDAYAAGGNWAGLTGTGNTDRNARITKPTRVRLPAGEKARADEQSWAVDRYNGFVITESGRVYGWGENRSGQLGMRSIDEQSYSPNPVRIGTFGNAGQPKAVQVAFDGDTLYIVDSDGGLYSAGMNNFGQVGTRMVRLRNLWTYNCLTAKGTDVRTEACNGDDNQLWNFDKASGRMQIRNNWANPAKPCFDNHKADEKTIYMHTCNPSIAQKFHVMSFPSYDISTHLVNDKATGNNKCVAEIATQPGHVWLANCDGDARAQWHAYIDTLHKIELPGGRKASSVSTDQFFATTVTTDGKAYSWGLNNMALGNGVSVNNRDLFGERRKLYNPDPVEFILPAGASAVDSWTTSNGWSPHRANTFVMTSDGRVFGAGSNIFGQLGIGRFGGGHNGSYPTPQQMLVLGSGSDLARRVRSGYGTTVVYTANGRVFTVGNNSNGQLGDGTTTSNHTPAAHKHVNSQERTLLF